MKGFEQPKDSEPREGAGFIMKEGISPTTPQSDISVEFRPGESSESVMAEKMAEKNKRHEKEKERTKYFTTEADWTEDLLKSMLEHTNPYSETFKIKSDGTFDTTRIDGIPVFLKLDDFTPAGLYKIAQEIEEKYSGYHFTFETDAEGKWIKYTVSKN